MQSNDSSGQMRLHFSKGPQRQEPTPCRLSEPQGPKQRGRVPVRGQGSSGRRSGLAAGLAPSPSEIHWKGTGVSAAPELVKQMVQAASLPVISGCALPHCRIHRKGRSPTGVPMVQVTEQVSPGGGGKRVCFGRPEKGHLSRRATCPDWARYLTSVVLLYPRTTPAGGSQCS